MSSENCAAFVKLAGVIDYIDDNFSKLSNKNMSKASDEKKDDEIMNDQAFRSGYDLKYVYSKTSKSQILHNTGLDIYHVANKLRSSGIICTIGPASQSTDMIVKLIQSGLDVVRMNCSHGTHDYHKTTVKNANAAAEKTGIYIYIYKNNHIVNRIT